MQAITMLKSTACPRDSLL